MGFHCAICKNVISLFYESSQSQGIFHYTISLSRNYMSLFFEDNRTKENIYLF